MLKRIHIRGYKSLEDVEVNLSQLVVLFGPNAAGKSNFLDALQLLSKLRAARSRRPLIPPIGESRLSPLPLGTEESRGYLNRRVCASPSRLI